MHDAFGAPVPVSTRRDDLVTTAFGVWMVVGLFVDGWAHLNLPGLETFFTPWHGVLYSGFAAGAGWLAVLAIRGRRSGRSWSHALPRGYRLGAAGVVVFGAGGLGDMAWHVAFGVETSIDALLSLTHLVLLAGAALALSSALRAGWARPVDASGVTTYSWRPWRWSTRRCAGCPDPDGPRMREELPAILSLTLVTALAAFFLLYTSVFAEPAAAAPYLPAPEGTPGHVASEAPVAAGLAGYLITTVLLVLPLLIAERQGRRPRGTVVLLVGAVAWLSAAVGGFTAFGLTAAALVTVAAVLVEIVAELPAVAILPDRLRVPLLAASVPALLWSAQLTAVALTEGMGWPPALWSGVVVLSALTAAALSVPLAWRPQAEPGATT